MESDRTSAAMAERMEDASAISNKGLIEGTATFGSDRLDGMYLISVATDEMRRSVVLDTLLLKKIVPSP
jgi:hypothetical protein